nr:putative reverse transcriptase domain-containing protein [Tanacetum cinerariifolium]
MPPKRNNNIYDVYKRIMVRIEERLDRFVDQFTNRMNDMMNPRRRWDRNFVLIGEEVAKGSEIPEAMVPLLKKSSDVFPDELHDALPPLCDIQHHIDLEPGSHFPNMPHERMSPGEHAKLRRQAEEFVSNG